MVNSLSKYKTFMKYCIQNEFIVLVCYPYYQSNVYVFYTHVSISIPSFRMI